MAWQAALHRPKMQTLRKRIIAILLMIAIAVSLAACGEDSGRKTQEASGEAARRAEAGNFSLAKMAVLC